MGHMWFHTLKGKMEDQGQSYTPHTGQNDIGFVEPTQPGDGSKLPWVIGIIIAILIVAGGGFLLLRAYPMDGGESTNEEEGGLSTFATPKPAPTNAPAATPTSEPIAREDLTINVLNGTGVAGEASFLQAELRELGYENADAANAETQDETRTTVTYGPGVPDDVKEEINGLLEEMYMDVRALEKELPDYDIEILTGPRQKSDAQATTSPSPSPRAD